MKLSVLRIITYPALQLLAYSFIVVGSVYLYGPLILMHCISALHFQWFGILGVIGMLLTLASCVKKYEVLQIGGTILMMIAWIPHLRFEIHGIQQVALTNPMSILFGTLYIIISALVFLRFFLYYRDKRNSFM